MAMMISTVRRAYVVLILAAPWVLIILGVGLILAGVLGGEP
jgi:hypothetical protein